MMPLLHPLFDDGFITADSQAQSTFTIGLIAAGVAVVGFGCNLVPVKKVQTGDGMFYQWVDCAAIWFVGLVVQILRGSPPFYPLAMVGGILWTTGNMCVVPCIKTIGMGLGILLWGTTNLLTGWACGHFGLFGLVKDEITRPTMNYLGLAFALFSFGLFGLVKDEITRPTMNYLGLAFALFRLVLFLFVKADAGVSKSSNTRVTRTYQGSITNTENDPLLLPQHLQDHHVEDSSVVEVHDQSWVDRLSPSQKRIMGSSLALMSGCMYGFTFVPCLYIQQNYPGASDNGLDYAFSQFCGIFGASTAYFLVYSSYKQNRPQLPPNLIWPSAICGFMWAIAQLGWLVSTFNLSMSVSFPIITSGPAVIAAAWGVLYFREIRGWKNYIVLLIGVLAVIAASVLSALSRV